MATEDAQSRSAATQNKRPRVAYYLVTRVGAFVLLLGGLVATGAHGIALWIGLFLASMLAALIGFRLWVWYALRRTNR